MLITGNVVSYMHMSEQTPTLQSPEQPSFDDHWNDVDEIQRASQAARALDLNEAANIHAEQDAAIALKKKHRNRGIAAGLIATGVVGGGFAAHQLGQGPEFSETTNEYVVQDGDGLYDAAQEIQGIDSIDIRDAVHHIQVDPANVDVLSDGLQPGEVIIIPDSVE